MLSPTQPVIPRVQTLGLEGHTVKNLRSVLILRQWHAGMGENSDNGCFHIGNCWVREGSRASKHLSTHRKALLPTTVKLFMKPVHVRRLTTTFCHGATPPFRIRSPIWEKDMRGQAK
jgi:hypothetical protein